MAFPIRIPTGARTGTISIDANVELFPLEGGPVNSSHPAIIAPATSALHDLDGVKDTPGFIFTGTSGTTYWVRASQSTLNDSTAEKIAAAVAADRLKARVVYTD